MTTKPTCKTLLWFLAFIVPLYIIDQITKWWCVLHFNIRTFVTVKGENGELIGHRPVWVNEAGQWKIDVIENYFWLPRVHNQGVAWGIGNGTDWAPIVFFIVPILAFILITVLWRKGFFKIKPAHYAAPLLLAGILGNFTDRCVQGFYLEHLKDASFWERLSSGYVVDFIAVKIPIINYNYPVFNVADSCVTIAATLLFITAIFEKKLAQRQGISLENTSK